MTPDVMKGKWKELRPHVRERWSAFSDEDIDAINGDRGRLIEMIQERYGYRRDKAEREVVDFTSWLQSSI